MNKVSRTIVSGLMALALPGLAHAATGEVQYIPGAPTALYSAAVRVDDMLILSGQLGWTADGKFPAGMEAQTRQSLDNVAAILKAQGASMADVVKCTAMLSDMSQWADFNKVYATYFTPGRLPTRSAFGASSLPAGALVEIECWAVSPKKP